MNSMISYITAMHERFELPLPKAPTLTDYETTKFRLNFLKEELFELVESFGYMQEPDGSFDLDGGTKQDPEGILDALVDLQVVLLGFACQLGFFNLYTEKQFEPLDDHTIFEEAFFRVMRANMQKVACKTVDESKRGYALDLRKPAGWQPPYLKDLVRKMCE